MGIPESQCSTWSNAAPTQAAVTTHEAIRKALEEAKALREKNYEVFLQGSYKNSTNIRGDSDVDVVAQLNSSWHHDLTGLPADEAAEFKKAFSDADYLWTHFQNDVQVALKDYFGSSEVVVRNKCITVKPKPGRLSGDVVAVLQYRKYKRFRGRQDQDYIEGVVFWGRTDNRQIINYPKPHYNNGVAKNLLAGGHYKPAVRMIKNARTYLRDRGVITDDLSPSYFVEGLLYNVPHDRYVESRSQTFLSILKWLADTPNWGGFMCQNGVIPLFGNTPEQWDLPRARQLHKELVTLFLNWGK